MNDKNRRKLSETIVRYLRMLQMVPQGRRIDAGTIERQLADEGIVIHRRSIQRDLELLSVAFPGLTCDNSTKPYGWTWMSSAPLMELPPMGLATAVTLELMRAYAAPVLPRATFKTLQPYFDRARASLQRSPNVRMARWPRKVKVLPRGLELLPPSVSDAVLEVVYAALLEERQFHMRYRKRGAAHDTEYDVDPLGLVVRGGVLVLVCLLGGEDQVKQINLHRIKDAQLLDTRARIPTTFRLEAHLHDGGVSFKLGKPIRLRMIVDRRAAITLHETPLDRTQQITEWDDDNDLVEVTVPDTLELRGWIASYGPLIEVLEPKALRDEMARAAHAMVARYASSPSRRVAGRGALRKTRPPTEAAQRPRKRSG
ncbi:MAG TPA: WYL domain-containing protein [Polyangiaceae bacterium]|nr:WYL domain-containing protein [Polyangiaceae bacterium]